MFSFFIGRKRQFSRAEFIFSIGCLFAGAFLVATAVLIDLFVSFELILGGFGKRELAHFVGFFGMTTAFYFYASSCANRKMNFFSLALHLPFVVFVFAIGLYPELRPTVVPLGALVLTATLSLYYLVFAGFAHIKDNPIVTPTRFLFFCGLSMLFISGSWEWVEQPLIQVYGGDARGEWQGWQIVADLSGISLAIIALWFISSKLVNDSIENTYLATKKY